MTYCILRLTASISGGCTPVSRRGTRYRHHGSGDNLVEHYSQTRTGEGIAITCWVSPRNGYRPLPGMFISANTELWYGLWVCAVVAVLNSASVLSYQSLRSR